MESTDKYYDYFHLSPSHLPSPPQPPPTSPYSFLPQQASVDNKISPSILLLISIIAVIFLLYSLIHLLIHLLIRPTDRDPEESDNVTAHRGELQQLFRLHDAGVDQSLIDALPVFLYKAIIGVEDPLDCAVCLCEFEPDDELRLLPNCSHAFHIECIDTWLLCQSTCPLCRRKIPTDLPSASNCSPVVVVLESGSQSSSEIGPDHVVQNSHVGLAREEEILEKVEEIVTNEELPPPPPLQETKVVAVKLGKLRNLDPTSGVEGSSSSCSNLERRRCFSMGAFEYVMDEKSQLQVVIKPPEKKAGGNKPYRSRLSLSECGCHSQREGFREFEPGNGSVVPNPSAKNESFSFSKTWLRWKKDNPPAEAKRELKLSKEETGRIESELDCGSEFDIDLEAEIWNDGRVLSRREETPSFARRTLLWVMGRNQNHKVVNHI